MLRPYIAIDASALFKKNKTGVEWYTRQLLKYLVKEWKDSDPRVVLLAPRNHAEIHRSVFTRNKHWHFKLLPGRYFWTQHCLRKFLKRCPPALLFSPSYVAPRFLSRDIPTVTVVHGLEGEYFPEFRSAKQTIADHLLVIPVLRRDGVPASTIIAVSERTKKDLNYFFGIPPDRIKVVPSGPGTLDDANLHAQRKRLSAKAFLSPSFRRAGSDRKADFLSPRNSRKNIKFLFLGGDNERKNLELAIRIFLKLKHCVRTHCNASLYVAGDIKNRKILNRRKENIIPLGYISEKEKIKQLETADFLLYPSFYEGFGFPVLEAQACGAVPIILKGGGLEETGGKGAIEFNIEKENKSIIHIMSHLKNRKNYQRIQKIGFANVQKYSWRKCAQEVRRILLKITK